MKDCVWLKVVDSDGTRTPPATPTLGALPIPSVVAT
jgi:hypothetical protein